MSSLEDADLTEVVRIVTRLASWKEVEWTDWDDVNMRLAIFAFLDTYSNLDIRRNKDGRYILQQSEISHQHVIRQPEPRKTEEEKQAELAYIVEEKRKAFERYQEQENERARRRDPFTPDPQRYPPPPPTYLDKLVRDAQQRAIDQEWQQRALKQVEALDQGEEQKPEPFPTPPPHCPQCFYRKEETRWAAIFGDTGETQSGYLCENGHIWRPGDPRRRLTTDLRPLEKLIKGMAAPPDDEIRTEHLERSDDLLYRYSWTVSGPVGKEGRPSPLNDYLRAVQSVLLQDWWYLEMVEQQIQDSDKGPRIRVHTAISPLVHQEE